MRSVHFITWQDGADPLEPLAQVNVNFATDNSWNVSTLGEYHLKTLPARFVYVDNTLNNGLVTVSIGPANYTISQFASQLLNIPPLTTSIGITGTVGSVPLTFYKINRNSLGGQNQAAVNAETAAALAALVGQTVGPIVNPAFDIWPEGAGRFAFGATATYGPEGWSGLRAGGVAGAGVTRVVGTAGSTYGAKIDRAAADASVAVISFGTQFQSADSVPFAGQTVAVSYTLKAGVNFSAAGGVLTAQLVYGTGNDQNVIAGFTGATLIATGNHAVGAAARYTISGVVPATATQLGLILSYTPVGVAGADDSFTVERVQIDIGTTAQSFRPIPYAVELARCNFFYQVFSSSDSVAPGQAYLGTNALCTWFYDLKRTTPTVTISAAGDFDLKAAGGGSLACTAMGFNPLLSRCQIDAAVAAGLVAGNATILAAVNANARFRVNARM